MQRKESVYRVVQVAIHTVGRVSLLVALTRESLVGSIHADGFIGCPGILGQLLVYLSFFGSFSVS